MFQLIVQVKSSVMKDAKKNSDYESTPKIYSLCDLADG